MPLRITPDLEPPRCENCGAPGEMFTRRKHRMVSWCGVCDPHCGWCLKSLAGLDAAAQASHYHECAQDALAYFGFDAEPQLAKVFDFKNRPFDLDTE